MSDAIEELRALVLPILAAAHHAYCHDTGCFDGDDISNPEIERAAMLVVARARAEALREAKSWIEPTHLIMVGGHHSRTCALCLYENAVAAAEALVARLEEKQG